MPPARLRAATPPIAGEAPPGWRERTKAANRGAILDAAAPDVEGAAMFATAFFLGGIERVRLDFNPT